MLAGMSTPAQNDEHIRCIDLVLEKITDQVNDLVIEFNTCSSQLASSALPIKEYQAQLLKTTEALWRAQAELHTLSKTSIRISNAPVTITES